MSLTLSDALSHYRSVSDSTHKYWGYFQVVAGGTAAFAWSSEASADAQLFVFLSIAFAVFAVLNGRLVVSSQAEAIAAVQCVRNHASNSTVAVPSELAPLLEGIKPDPTALICLLHAGLSLATLAAVWWRYASLAS
ncbi:hypothetical protein D3C75_905640 [compost metagenome]